jgi:hypothetical protein
VSKRDHAAIALQYANDVVAGASSRASGRSLACRRQLSDLERQETAAFPFRYEPQRGARCAGSSS